MRRLERAIAIAAEAHSGTKDKAGMPYIFHPLRVMLKMRTDDERIVAVLHDVVEDSKSWPLRRLRAEGFSGKVLKAIDSVTKRENEEYADFIERASRNPIGRKVKIADVLDNLDVKRIARPTRKDYERFKKYRRALRVLRKADRRPSRGVRLAAQGPEHRNSA